MHTRFSRWADKEVWQGVFRSLTTEADNEYAMIDSTIVRAHQHSVGAKKDQAIRRRKGGLSAKIHATVNTLGKTTGFHLAGGQACDLEGADVLLPDTPADTVLADKAYDADVRVIEPLKQAGKTVVIASKCNRKEARWYDKHLYKTRHLIENFFCKLKQFQAIATRYDKTARNFLAAIQLA